MTKVRVMYWKEIPVQVQAEDETCKVSVPLQDRFQEGADSVAMFDGSMETDAYLQAWSWGQDIESDESAVQAADKLANLFNEHFPQDFAAQIRELDKAGKRDSRPGSIDDWIRD